MTEDGDNDLPPAVPGGLTEFTMISQHAGVQAAAAVMKGMVRKTAAIVDANFMVGTMQLTLSDRGYLE